MVVATLFTVVLRKALCCVVLRQGQRQGCDDRVSGTCGGKGTRIMNELTVVIVVIIDCSDHKVITADMSDLVFQCMHNSECADLYL